jgi:hypothetical protein
MAARTNSSQKRCRPSRQKTSRPNQKRIRSSSRNHRPEADRGVGGDLPHEAAENRRRQSEERGKDRRALEELEREGDEECYQDADQILRHRLTRARKTSELHAALLLWLIDQQILRLRMLTGALEPSFTFTPEKINAETQRPRDAEPTHPKSFVFPFMTPNYTSLPHCL